MSEPILISIAGIVILGAVAQWLAWRVGLPSILLLLTFGIIAGPLTGRLDPDALLGDLLFPLVSLSVALILFEGGLSLKLSEFRKVGAVVRNLVTLGALVTWLLTTLAARFLLHLPMPIAALLGAVLVVTGPTVIGPMLRQMRPAGSVGAALKWEGIVIDPIGALLAVLIFEAIAIGEPGAAALHVAGAVTKTIVFGGGIGAAAALLLIVMLERYWIADFLQNAVSLMLVVAAFTLANHLQHESGLLAVTVMGFALANQKRVDVEDIVEFKENLRVLLISALFIVLAARLELAQLTGVLWSALAFVAVLVLVVRPLCVAVATWRTGLPDRERWFLAWIAPRGIVAAAVASVFAIRLESIPGYAAAGQLVPITFITIIVTVTLYGLASPVIARRLGVAEANPQGILFAGAHPWVRDVASLLQRKGYRVLLVDSNPDHVHAARMSGLPTYAGSILSERTLDEIDLGGLGRLLAVTPNDWVNVLAVKRFNSVFGRAECYQLHPPDDSIHSRKGHGHLHGRWLFRDQITHATLESRLAAGYTTRATRISEEFNYDDYRLEHGADAIPLFLVHESGQLKLVNGEQDAVGPVAGQTLISLVRGKP
ncbi:MAG: cation:proton antiporter [Phycisphaerae bacterium]